VHAVGFNGGGVDPVHVLLMADNLHWRMAGNSVSSSKAMADSGSEFSAVTTSLRELVLLRVVRYF